MFSLCRSNGLTAFRGKYLLLTLALTVGACSREQRTFREPPPNRELPQRTVESELRPGGPSRPKMPVTGNYEGNAYAINEGQRLFNWYNCSGCHANGGGGMGPPLIDDYWIYGSEPDNIHETILEGRPNGMPAWAGRIPDYQVWQLVAYVRSLGNLEPKAATPVRQDHLMPRRGD
jgi:cytochrome c oxidase cbb3-type subunit 3